MKVEMSPEDNGLFNEILERSGQNIKECYQCTKCSGICPFSSHMDYSPNQILEMIFHGMKEELLECRSIQMCIGCATCEANCPSEVEMYEIMRVLREMADEEGVESREENMLLFNEIFLDIIKDNGRSHDVGLTLKYNAAKGQYLKDVILGPKMFMRGMMGVGDLIPPKIKNRKEVKNIFDNVARKRGGI
ncbi:MULTISPECIES: 4Fe-4S dicluster domain-containing protein [unclassified Candidatus Frackibacter]|jgi:heterodisulfide reductase subunit C|uniref:4Fe-4S dicluster domain-containing protein n=1 Tax=unclassified Candidatus Frackibacter TaxID=2648818 RepID=UPI0007942789|nr:MULTISPECIES: 4Fe-4S dicluster domain-containing protein [unclassified Candidatus Frackibacter]KXS43726.1 MAG: heterodisulfide reductase subunit C [Candidatus Frackibacter sp. T328-2]SDC20792.1 heterodisulfide reductase subunit C [Candidatus Frackibacter sp. WG11]SEM50949.1 heterodisulfide reductase subunit C [Candidatus Frackibacter sp. WG12]SFL52268.1 heterodisulfide reductase subunit C [Candidatus Frackibacter sp. WG13]